MLNFGKYCNISIYLTQSNVIFRMGTHPNGPCTLSIDNNSSDMLLSEYLEVCHSGFLFYMCITILGKSTTIFIQSAFG